METALSANMKQPKVPVWLATAWQHFDPRVDEASAVGKGVQFVHANPDAKRHADESPRAFPRTEGVEET